MKILLGTGNKHKIDEMTRIIDEYKKHHGIDIDIVTLNDFEKVPEPIEDGNTFEENAKIKAKYYYDTFKMPTLTDDSGIVVDALGGMPGIYSARYACIEGGDSSSAANRKKLLVNLENVENRNAHFMCSMALYNGEKFITTEGRFEGSILQEETGENGFGYDCLFFSNDFDKPLGLLSDDEKDQVSHRGRALRKMLDEILQIRP